MKVIFLRNSFLRMHEFPKDSSNKSKAAILGTWTDTFNESKVILGSNEVRSLCLKVVIVLIGFEKVYFGGGGAHLQFICISYIIVILCSPLENKLESPKSPFHGIATGKSHVLFPGVCYASNMILYL